MTLAIREFGGEVPRTDPKHLPENAAQLARNVKVWNGVLEALKAPDLVATLAKTGTMQSIYRLPYDGSDYWLHWPGIVDAARGPVADAVFDRVYYTGDAEPRVTSAEMASQKTDTVDGTDNYPSGYGESGSTEYPRAFYAMGIPRPLTAPTVGTVTGGSGATEARAYVYTFVDEWGQESAPSPPSALQTGRNDGTWPLSGMNTAPLNTGTITGAAHSGGLVTVTTSAAHWLLKGHEVTIAGVVGMTDLNATFRVHDVPSATTFRVSLTTAQSYTSDGTWTRGAPYNIASLRQRIYRVLTGIDGESYLFVVEQSASATYNDAKTADELGEVLPTADPNVPGSDWDMPPGDLIGLVSLPGGYMAGFREGVNEVCFSEPNAPYAWPVRYRQKTDWPIVGLGVWGSTLSVCTTAILYQAVGFHPENMALSRADGVFPCRSRRSIVSTSTFGVLFASDRGLVMDGPQGTVLATGGFYDRDAWQELIQPDGMVAMEFDGRYHGFWQLNDDEGSALVFDGEEMKGAISRNSFRVEGAWADPETGKAYVVDADGVKQWDADLARRQTYEWISKQFVLPLPEKYTAAKVVAEFTQTPEEAAAIIAANAEITARNAIVIATVPTGSAHVDPLGGSVGAAPIATYAVADDILEAGLDAEIEALQFEIFGDGALVYSTTVSDVMPFRLDNRGAKYCHVHLRLSGNVPVQQVEIANTMSELARL